MPRGLESALSAAITQAAVPRIEFLGELGPWAKVGVGGAAVWITWTKTGVVNAVIFGAGIGLVIDGVADLLEL